MNFDQRKSFRIQIPEGREHAVLVVKHREIQARILDESAGGFAVALIENVDVQQNQVHLLKTTTGLYQTRVARIEHFADGKLLGLVRLDDLTEAGEKVLGNSSRYDHLFKPQANDGSKTGSIAAGIVLAVAVGVGICGLALFGSQHLPAQQNPDTSPNARESAIDVQESPKQVPLAAVEPNALMNENIAAIDTQPLDSIVHEPQSKFAPEVLYRLQLTPDQSRRIRGILDHSPNDLARLETEIRSILTPEQVREWRTLAP